MEKSRLRAVSYFSLQSFCTRNPNTRTGSWFAIALAEIRTRRVLREKADCKQSRKRVTLYYSFILRSYRETKYWNQILLTLHGFRWNSMCCNWGRIHILHAEPWAACCHANTKTWSWEKWKEHIKQWVLKETRNLVGLSVTNSCIGPFIKFHSAGFTHFRSEFAHLIIYFYT